MVRSVFFAGIDRTPEQPQGGSSHRAPSCQQPAIVHFGTSVARRPQALPRPLHLRPFDPFDQAPQLLLAQPPLSARECRFSISDGSASSSASPPQSPPLTQGKHTVRVRVTGFDGVSDLHDSDCSRAVRQGGTVLGWCATMAHVAELAVDSGRARVLAFILGVSWKCQFAEERQGKRLTATTGGIVVDGTGTPASSVRLILKGERIISDVRLGQFLALAAVRLL